MCAANPLVSIIIVTFNSVAILPRCLAALEKTAYMPFEIIVVDNASTDGTCELVDDRRPTTRAFPEPERRDRRPILIQNVENLGFGRACNVGADAARGEILVFFNPDVVVVTDWLGTLVACFQAHSNALISPQTLYPGDTLRATAQWTSEEAAVPGGALLVPKVVWHELGGFDSHFFLYWEDTELCWRAWLLGFRVLTDQRSYVFHQRGGSAGRKRWDAERTKNSLHTYLKLMRWRVVAPFVLMLALKTIVKLATHRDKALVAAWHWNWRNLGITMAERREICARRKGDPAHLERLITLHERRMRIERRDREKGRQGYRNDGKQLI